VTHWAARPRSGRILAARTIAAARRSPRARLAYVGRFGGARIDRLALLALSSGTGATAQAHRRFRLVSTIRSVPHRFRSLICDRVPGSLNVSPGMQWFWVDTRQQLDCRFAPVALLFAMAASECRCVHDGQQPADLYRISGPAVSVFRALRHRRRSRAKAAQIVAYVTPRSRATSPIASAPVQPYFRPRCLAHVTTQIIVTTGDF
jgi:hypothetical protein